MFEGFGGANQHPIGSGLVAEGKPGARLDERLGDEHRRNLAGGEDRFESGLRSITLEVRMGEVEPKRRVLGFGGLKRALESLGGPRWIALFQGQ